MPHVIECLLLDFDGVLVRYARHLRVRHLAAGIGCSAAQVQAALFDSGLERAYDSGMATDAYLQQLGEALQTTVSRDGKPDYTGDGQYVMGSWIVTGESRPYSAGAVANVKPAHDYGAVELLARYSRIDLDETAPCRV